MRPEKGVDVLLRAFGTVASQRRDVRLVLCGPGDPEWAFAAAADAFGTRTATASTSLARARPTNSRPATRRRR